MRDGRRYNDEHQTEAERAFGRAIRKEMRRIAQIQNPWVAAIAIIVLGTMQIVALQRGVDGALFGLVVAAIAGIAGYVMHGLRDRTHGQ